MGALLVCGDTTYTMTPARDEIILEALGSGHRFGSLRKVADDEYAFYDESLCLRRRFIRNGANSYRVVDYLGTWLGDLNTDGVGGYNWSGVAGERMGEIRNCANLEHLFSDTDEPGLLTGGPVGPPLVSPRTQRLPMTGFLWILLFVVVAAVMRWPEPQPLEVPAPPPVSVGATWHGAVCPVYAGPDASHRMLGKTRKRKVYRIYEWAGNAKRIGPKGWILCD